METSDYEGEGEGEGDAGDFEPADIVSPARIILATSSQKPEIMDLSLVLASQWIKHWIEFDGKDFSLSLEETEVIRAQELIDLYRFENRDSQEAAITGNKLDLFITPLIFLCIPVIAYFAIESKPWANWWHSLGNANARAILAGEWWRSLTATTLHADEQHFLSNLVSGYFIINLLNHRLGIGTLMVLASLGGAMANFLVAATSPSNHTSIGFSSVVFCALGLLAAVETLYLPRQGEKNLRRLTPLISAFFIAVMVGLGENADIKAHFYGFGIGVGFGFLTRYLPKLANRPAWQAGQVILTFALYAMAWAMAVFR